MPDSTRHQAGPVGAPSSPSNDQESVSGSRPSATSGLFGGRRTAFVVLGLSLVIAVVVGDSMRRTTNQHIKQEFDARVSELSRDVRDRMSSFEDILSATRAFILASGHVTSDEWNTFQDAQRFEFSHPGMHGIGLAQEVRSAELGKFIRSVRVEGESGFRVLPVGDRAVYAPIRFSAARNRDIAARGFDMYTDPTRKAAMERARDTGKPSLSDLTVIKVGTQSGHPSLLFYLPVYGRTPDPNATVEQRRAALVSYVYIPLLTAEFMGDIAAEAAQKNLALGISGRDGQAILPAPVDFPDRAVGLSAVEKRDIYGQPWTIQFQALPGFARAVGGTGAMVFGAGALIISLLLFALVWILTSTRLRAEALAREMTRGLRESEARFKSIAHLSADWFWEQDENYRFTKRSGGGHGWSEAAIADTVGKTRWELAGGAMSEQDWSAHRADLDARKPFKDLILRRSPPNEDGDAGVVHYLSVSGEPFYDALGIFKGYRGIGSDITERMERDNALQESEARFRTAFDAAAIGMAIVSLDGQWLQVNPPLCRMLGYSEADLKRLTFQDVTHPDDLETDLGYVEQLLRGEIDSYQMEKRYFHKDGHVVWVQLSGAVVRGRDGAPSHFVAQMQDITARKQTELELAANRRFLVDLIDAIPMPLTVKGDDRRFVIVNEATGRLHQRPAGDFIGKLDGDFYPAERVEQIRAEDDAVAGSGTPLEQEQSFETLSGEVCWVIKHKRRIVSPDGRRWLLTALFDITGRNLAEIALKKSEARFRALTEMSSDFYWEQDENFRITAMSTGVEKSVGIDSQWHIGKTRWEVPGIMLTEREWDAHRLMLKAHQPFSDFTYERLGREGETRHLSISGQPIFDAQGIFTGYRGVGKDVTAEKVAEARIQYLAYHDSLTELPNRSSFSLILNPAIARARRDGENLAVLFIDLDRFKNINDTLGHDAGDTLLHEIGKRLRHGVRQADTVARFGGDEFVVLLQDIGEPDDVAKVAHKILLEIASALDVLDQEIRVTASIGISVYPQDGQDEQTLMKNADIAMYHAKQEGKNNFKFHSEQMDTHTLARLALESSLRHALERNEFKLHYQAKIDLRTSRMTGMEALLRWRHPDLGMIPPAQFIPIAEELGLIESIGQWVIRTACRQNKAWQDQGFPPMRMAVNLSPRQFNDDKLVESITAILEETRMDPACLELEITESMIMHSVETTMQKLTALGSAGIRIAIDDFGTGHSSLAYLKRLPIDTLKIDRSFVADLTRSTEDKTITAAIITMGKSLDLTVVAEGVETQEQLDFLRAHGCDEFQGYYAHKPMPADEFVQLLQIEMDQLVISQA